MKTLQIATIGLLVLAGCLLPGCTHDELLACPLPSLAAYSSEDLTRELADRGVDGALGWVFGEDD